jgi:sugar phosphate isomerase/epimerase
MCTPTTTLSQARTALSIFSRTWPATGDIDSLAATVRLAGFTQTHLNLASVGLDSLPASFDVPTLLTVRRTFDTVGVRITSVSATYNLINPNRARRRYDADRAIGLIHHVPLLGADLVSLCAGTCHPHDMWAWHPDNTTPTAWTELVAAIRQLLVAARLAGVRLGIEPDGGTMIWNARQARRLLDELGTDAEGIGIILDPGNLVDPDQPDTQREMLAEAFDLLGPHIVAVHAKDRGPDGDAAPGEGVVDFDYVLGRWAELPEPVPVVLHNLRVDQIVPARQFVLARLAER